MTTKTQTPAVVHDTIIAAGKSPDRDIRFVREMAIGQHVRQGDVYLLRLAKRPADFDKTTTNRQLAPGTSKGSRHVAEGKAVSLFIATDERAARSSLARLPGVQGRDRLLVGACVEAADRFIVSHPEHAHHSLPAGCYAVLFQLDPRSMRRVED